MPQMETNEVSVGKAFDRVIILADESEWSGTVDEEFDTPSLWVWLDPFYSMDEIFQAFNDPEKTRTIKSVLDSKISYDTIEKTYENYTRLTNFGLSGNRLRVQLRKGGDSE